MDDITKSPLWKPFEKWFKDEYTYAPHPRDRYTRMSFLLFEAGAKYATDRENEIRASNK